ncbi:hypothetical protein BOX37_09295 [Nocardia mangyaensis]|uniref:Uncharacterized protein n=1 Tax=Nocardia mangyaensis TaxID=2213200 RepID=A0A1J0VQ90_9NOCA|nr:hypothetical protein [Nocardia mangyaensis]APE34127.1 hypothetical protein BOX37_09295 [Nocardia mangyaensis]
MAVVTPSAASATVDIAGSAWPVYKLEALVAGLVVGALLLLVVGSAQTAVLVGAAVAAVRWIIGATRAHRTGD